MKSQSSKFSSLFNWFAAIWIMLAMIAVGALFALNSTFIYGWLVDRHDLASQTLLPRHRLVYNYRELIHYLQLPWRTPLHLPDFPVSESGAIHFGEVKQIFLIFYGILIFLVVAWPLAIIKNRQVLPVFNKSANLILTLTVVAAIGMVFDFYQTFVLLHRVLFRNDHWYFDPLTDPIIMALPEELFLVKGILLISLLLIQAALVKFLFYRYYPRNKMT